MFNITKSDKIKEVLQIFARTTGKRTSEKFAIETIDTAIKKLEPAYDFLKYVTIERTSHYEGMDFINVKTEIDNVEIISLGKAVSDILAGGAKLQYLTEAAGTIIKYGEPLELGLVVFVKVGE